MTNKILEFKARHKTSNKSKILIAFSFFIICVSAIFLIEKFNPSFINIKKIYSNSLVDIYEQKKQLDDIAKNPKISSAITNAEGNSNVCHSGEYVDKEMVKDYLDKTIILLQEISSELDRFENQKLIKNEKIIRFNHLVENSNDLNEFKNKNLIKCFFDHSLVITVSKRGQMIRLSLEELQKNI
jgi:hypothetical protein